MLSISIFFKRKFYYPIIILVVIKILDYWIVSLSGVYIESLINLILDVGIGFLGIMIGSLIGIKYAKKYPLFKTKSYLYYYYQILRIILFITPALIILIIYLFGNIGFNNLINDYIYLFLGILYNRNNNLISLINWFGINLLYGVINIVILIYLIYFHKESNTTIFTIDLVFSLVLLIFIFPELVYYIIYFISGNSLSIFLLLYIAAYIVIITLLIIKDLKKIV